MVMTHIIMTHRKPLHQLHACELPLMHRDIGELHREQLGLAPLPRVHWRCSMLNHVHVKHLRTDDADAACSDMQGSTGHHVQ